ncbi:hypothetical protein SDC9_164579 [bioreactor metagenome]|uniref:Uncharacterized protein n=1 Tax=bioreactor metagenome TaxID=1076179 RepID=A0A645FUN5_9ZZZZ
MVALIQKAEERPLQHIAQRHRQHHAHQQHGDEVLSQIRRQRERHVGADHVEAAVRKIDHPHDAEDQRQARGQQKQKQSVLN